MKSPNGKYTLKMQTDGNLVLYCNDSALWSSDTSDKTVSGGLMFQSDGNLVLYSPDHTALWDSDSYDKGVTAWSCRMMVTLFSILTTVKLFGTPAPLINVDLTHSQRFNHMNI